MTRKMNKYGKTKTRQEPLKIINAEREKVHKGKTISSSHNYINNVDSEQISWLVDCPLPTTFGYGNEFPICHCNWV